jgi:hypothetical protein
MTKNRSRKKSIRGASTAIENSSSTVGISDVPKPSVDIPSTLTASGNTASVLARGHFPGEEPDPDVVYDGFEETHEMGDDLDDEANPGRRNTTTPG